MPARIVALLIALALFWSGFNGTGDGSAFAASSTAEAQLVELASASNAQLRSEAAHRGWGESGDDPVPEPQHLPSQAEASSDLPEVIIVLAEAQPRGGSALPPRACVPPMGLSPYLDGPQRPPCRPQLVG